MSVLLILVSMTIAVQHLRFSFSISISSHTFRPFSFRTLGVQTSIFQARSEKIQKANRERQTLFSNHHHQQQQQMQLTMNDMMGVERQVNENRMEDDENKDTSVSTSFAKLVPSTKLDECGERLRQGGLVAFPTETVYGLGCNALNSSAIIKVFEAKERPLTDPLITHVTDNQVAFDLWEADIDNSLEGKALQSLCKQFWPGPLTLVAKASPKVPPILVANTGFCACRSPRHPISIALINAAKVPIAAPSANKFGHVSPTRSSHVWHDLQHEDVWILEEELEEENTASSSCEVGVESSVLKVEMCGENERGKVTLLRQGAISLQNIEQCLEQAGLGKNFEVIALTKSATDEKVAHVAPGQTIRHYSPDIPSYILSGSLCDSASKPISHKDEGFLLKSVLIDFGGRIKAWEPLALEYRDLSENANSAEATKHVFETLRWAEKIEGANQILFPEIADEGFPENTKLNQTNCDSHNALILALKDRLTRAASGVVIHSLDK